MGLDMYLHRGDKTSVEEWKRGGRRDENPWEEVAYWRKANAIRKWFCDNCGYPEDGNCDEILITKDDLEKLIGACKAVIENIQLARELLPTEEGFFFGSTEYDEWYVEDLQSTVTQCEEVIKTTDWESQVVRYTDWW